MGLSATLRRRLLALVGASVVVLGMGPRLASASPAVAPPVVPGPVVVSVVAELLVELPAGPTVELAEVKPVVAAPGP